MPDATKTIKVNAKTLKIHMKVCDQFECKLVDADGAKLCVLISADFLTNCASCGCVRAFVALPLNSFSSIRNAPQKIFCSPRDFPMNSFTIFSVHFLAASSWMAN